MAKPVLGIDVGGSGIKGALVDTKRGELIEERFRLETPQPATPEAMAETFARVVEGTGYTSGPIGVGFPAIVHNGTALSAANIDKSWLGRNVERLFGQTVGKRVYVCNDADAAGLASRMAGSARKERGTVLFLTLGTGIGSAMFTNGKLVRNTEFGHVYLKGMKIVAEKYCANSIRKKKELSFEEWGKRLDEYLHHMNRLTTPDLILLGGGVSKKFDLFSQYLTIDVPVRPAELRNEAGIIGAALYGEDCAKG